MRHRRYAVVAVMLVAVTAIACGAHERGRRAATQPAATVTPSGEVVWSLLPEAPLRPRHGAHGFWVDNHFLVMGGRDTPACPPHAACAPPRRPALRDGASYSPTTGRWTRVKPAPEPLGDGTTTVVDDVVYWWLPRGIDGRDKASVIGYDVVADRWQQLPTPPLADQREWSQLADAGGLLVAYPQTHERGRHPELVYNPADQSWRELPRDPLAPSYDRSIVWTGRELVLVAPDLVDNPGADEPSVYRAAAFDSSSGSWRRLPDSPVQSGWGAWFVIDSRVINAATPDVHGVLSDRRDDRHPFGGMLDPGPGTWSSLPEPPTGTLGFSNAIAADDRVILNGQGWLLDVPTGTWTYVPRPTGGTDDEQAVAIGDGDLYVWGGVTWGNDVALDNDQNPLSAAGWTTAMSHTTGDGRNQ